MSLASDKLYDITLWIPDAFQQRYNTKHGIGEYYPKRFLPEVQDLMKNLKSDDIVNIRPELVFQETDKERFKREISEAKLDFDSKILGKVL